MKVLLVGNYLPDGQQSMLRFAELMQRELQNAGHQVRLLQPAPILNRHRRPAQGIAKWQGYVDKFVLFPLLLKRAARWADIVHICDHSNALYTRVLQHRPHLVTCHDVLAIRSALGHIPENPTGWSGRKLQSLILRGLNRAQHVVCDSQSTLEQLVAISSLQASQMEMIYIGQNYPYTPLPRMEAEEIVRTLIGKETLQRGFIFHVGSNAWYKNRFGVMRIYNYLRSAIPTSPRPRLIMGGDSFTSEMRLFVQQNDLGDDVLEIVNCSNRQLQALYSLAQLLLFPSLAEGFGWPVLEAQACGCRVVTSNLAPLNEIGGDAALYDAALYDAALYDAALYIDPRDEKAVAQTVWQVLNETPAQKEARIESGLRNAAQFSNARMIDSYVTSYHKLAQRQRVR